MSFKCPFWNEKLQQICPALEMAVTCRRVTVSRISITNGENAHNRIDDIVLFCLNIFRLWLYQILIYHLVFDLCF